MLRGPGTPTYDDDRRTLTLYRPAELRALAAGFAVESVRTEDEWVQLFGRANGSGSRAIRWPASRDTRPRRPPDRSTTDTVRESRVDR